MVSSKKIKLFVVTIIISFKSFSYFQNSYFKSIETYATSYFQSPDSPRTFHDHVIDKEISELISIFDNKKKEITSDLIIKVDAKSKLHKLWGFGGSVTQSCIDNIQNLNSEDKKHFFKLLFHPKNGAGLNFLRIPLGGNDFSRSEHTLDDTDFPDTELKKMDLTMLDEYIQFAKRAIAENSNIHFMVTPWTPPAWMKDTKKLRGGQLLKIYYPTYAMYLTKAIQYLEQNKINVDFVTVLNEPLIGEAQTNWYFPQGYMSVQDQAVFISKYLVPTFLKYHIKTKVLAHDHNWDNSNEVIQYMSNSKEFKNSIKGIAYHCYGGGLNDIKRSLGAHPEILGFNTECSGQLRDNSVGNAYDFQWWMMTQSVDAIKLGMGAGVGWNLCLDTQGGPKTTGCQNCRGLVTVNKEGKNINEKFIKNPELFSFAQTSKFIDHATYVLRSISNKENEDSFVSFINSKKQIVVVVRNYEITQKTTAIYINDQFVEVVDVPPQGAITKVYSEHSETL